MVYITGDTHGDFRRIKKFCEMAKTTKNDTLIILGDSGLNYFTDLRNRRFKYDASKLPIKLFCIHGNHEERAELLPTYHKDKFWGATVLVEDDFPDLKFALDGEIYKIPTYNGIKEAIVIGGAYSVDKYYRLSTGNNWYNSEQPSFTIKNKVEEVLVNRNQKIDIILSHTCPFRYIPYEWFIGGIDQSKVDNSTEIWLDKIFLRINHFDKWYCGHYHGDKVIDKIEFMFENIKEL